MSKPNLRYAVEHPHRNVATVRMAGKANDEWTFLLRSDVHHDNPHCDWKMERRHLDEAVERGAGIIDNGDLFCAMQGKWDKRADKSAIRPEHQSGKYLDKLVDTAADFYRPYADNFIVIGRGNHETSIRRAHETDLTDRLVCALNEGGKRNIQAGGYGGWVRFNFTLRGSFRTSKVMHYYHGSGGGGPVTRGTIQTNRMAVYQPDADIVFTGHTHDEWVVPITRMRLSDGGKPYQDEQIHIRTPGYKNAYEDGFDGFEVERMHNPKPTGAAWLTFKAGGDRVSVEVARAK